MRKRKERHHTLQGGGGRALTSVSLPTSSCHPWEASATLIYAADRLPSSCQSYSFQRIYVTADAFAAAPARRGSAHLLADETPSPAAPAEKTNIERGGKLQSEGGT